MPSRMMLRCCASLCVLPCESCENAGNLLDQAPIVRVTSDEGPVDGSSPSKRIFLQLRAAVQVHNLRLGSELRLSAGARSTFHDARRSMDQA